MISQPNIITSIYELRHKFGIIGLTGRTGSGCSTVADLLCCSDFKGIEAPVPHIEAEGVSNDDRKYRIIYSYLENIWKIDKIKFIKIKVSVLILFIVLKDGYNNFIKSFEDSQNDKGPQTQKRKYTAKFNLIKKEFDEIHKTAEEYYEKNKFKQ